MSGGNYTFGSFAFDGERQLLLKHGCPVVLGQRGTALLGALLQARGMPVTKPELMDAAWPDLHVEESNLSVQIASLRKTLGKSQSGNDWIETVQRSGYRFSEVSERQTATAALPVIAKSNVATLAILPFTNLSSDTEQGFFADGLTEDLITALAKVPGMTVTARHSSFHFRGADPLEAATLLGVRYVAGGSVRRSGDRLRITAELTDTELARTLWSERFDRKLTDIFEAQDEIARQIATYIFSAVAPVHLKGRRTSSLEAYELV
jgi:TolB-like protein